MGSFRHAALCLLLAGCAGTEEPLPDAGDGKVHPPPNGVHTTEAEACSDLENVLRDQGLALGCSITLRPCPQLLRAQFTTACMEYDQGSVAGCVAYFAERSSCAELDSQVCVVVPYPGSEPAGCP